MKDIKGVGFEIPSKRDDFIRLDSLNSLSDCDIAIIDVSFRSTGYSTYENGFSRQHLGKPQYNSTSSSLMIQHSNHWEREIIAYLNTGRTLFIILSEKIDFYYISGQKLTGTGKSQSATTLLSKSDNYKFLPKLGNLLFHNARGKKIISCDSRFNSPLNDFVDIFSYERFIDKNEALLVNFTTKDKDKLLGGIIKLYEGYVVFLPKIDFSANSKYLKTNTEKSLWTEAGLQAGTRFCNYILEIDKSLKNKQEKSIKPNWIDDKLFELQKTLFIKSRINNTKFEFEKLANELVILDQELIESEKLNDLLFETGTPLENAVILALKILGYMAENYDDGVLELDQIIISPEGHRYIGECEGKDSKAIDITKFRQLNDALHEDLQREDVTEKAFGLLFGNPHRILHPDERNNPFTDKCINAAKRESIGLMETKELYRIAKYAMENDDENFKKQCRDYLHSNLGNIIVFPEI